MRHLIVTAFLVLAGCSSPVLQDIEPRPQATSKKLVIELLESITNKERTSFLELYNYATKDLAQFFDNSLKLIEAKEQFRERFILEYGEAFWEQFDSPRRSFHTQLFTEVDPLNLSAWIRETENPNEVIFLVNSTEIILRRFEDGWLIAKERIGENGLKVGEMAQVISHTAEVYETYKYLLGDDSVTIFYINRMMARELFAVVFGWQIPEPSKDVNWYDLQLGETVVREFLLEPEESHEFSIDETGPLKVGFRIDVPMSEDMSGGGSVQLSLNNGFGAVAGRSARTVFTASEGEELKFTITNHYGVYARVMVYKADE